MSAAGEATKKPATQPAPPIPFVVSAGINCASGMFAWLFAHPHEMIKNAITTGYTPPPDKAIAESQLRMKWSKTAVMAQTMYHEGGIARLYRGLNTGLTRQVVYTTSRLSLYEPTESLITQGGQRQATVVDRMVAGGLAGALAGFLSSPVEVPLVRMSKPGAPRVGLVGMSKIVYQDSGIAGFYRGCGPLMQRTFVVGVCQVGFFKQTVAALSDLRQRGVLPLTERQTVLASSLITGVFYAIITMPLEFARVRMSAQAGKAGSALKYKNTVQTVSMVMREEGIRTIYGVFTPYCGRCLTHTVVSFNAVHQMQKMYRSYVAGQ